ncbi:LysR family transcriptional regulator [uncultured Veillonella sp.]|uniref:LysR family transcriptional regulator n=1 Tax=uncultured Veillonella sp. TaxID=159268 RepID=UPI00262F65AA|nr:LysR family transcriptional regulator [uncultured Veillonella sp.]
MTLLQLKYVVAVANCGSMNKAAKELFIAQPSLTAAIKELEQELGITIFSRTNKGVVLSADGEEFLGYARQVMEQTTLIEEKYFGQSSVKHQFCVSTQHYSFAVEAFVDVLKSYGGNEYDFRIRETQTYEIIEDVAKLRSEIGILYLNEYNETILRKEFKHYDLTFHRLFLAKPHVFVSSSSPLAKKDVITLEDLEPYPRLSYEQGSHNSFYFSEEVLSTLDRPKDIVVCDRATLFNLLIGLNGYTLCSGVISEKLNGPNILAIPLDVDDHMEIGYILHNKVAPGKYCQLYIDALKRNTSDQI